jgi:hypothetical protein
MSCSWGEIPPASAYDDFDVADKAPDIPGHESGCPWETRRVCVCNIIFDARREAFNEGWRDGYDEGFDEGFDQGKRFGAS